MARLNSFYLPPEQWPSLVGDTVVLKGDEARHMATVLRTEAGHTVRLFDGAGRAGMFQVREISKKRALLEATQLTQSQPPAVGVTLAIGWGKSKRRNYLFEKTVELKGLGIAFWTANRSQGQMPKTKDVWFEKCVQAAKQCGNPHLPTLDVLSGGMAALIAFAEDFDQCYLAWESETAQVPLTPANLAAGRSLIVIGPEGGLDDDEAASLVKAGFSPVTLGNTVMRWETAATYCLSLGWFAQQDVS